MLKEIMVNLPIYQRNGSGWYFQKVISLEIHTIDFYPLKGKSYIPLPEFIIRKKAIINMENKDNKCFLWSVLRYLHPKEKHFSRINDLRKYENDLNFKGIDFPIKVKDIQKFEKQNPDLPGINIFSVNENNKIYPLRLNQKDTQKTIDLFLFSKDEKQHYSLIKNFSRLTVVDILCLPRHLIPPHPCTPPPPHTKTPIIPLSYIYTYYPPSNLRLFPCLFGVLKK